MNNPAGGCVESVFTEATHLRESRDLDLLFGMAPHRVIFEKGKKRSRNDRVIAVPWDTVSDGPMLPEIALDAKLRRAITRFFEKYNEAQGKRFRASASAFSGAGGFTATIFADWLNLVFVFVLFFGFFVS